MSDMEEFSPPWLVAKVDQRLELMIQHGALAIARESGAPMIMTFLDEGSPGMSEEERERWERTCDRCGEYIPDDGEFYTGHMNRTIEGIQIFMAFGVCGSCKAEHHQKGTEK
jgi:hypothetical protein